MQDETNQPAAGPAFVAVGIVLIASSLFADVALSRARDGFGAGQILLLVCGLLIGCIGLATRFGHGLSWLDSLTRLYRLAAFSVFNVVLLIAGVETAGWIIQRQESGSPEPPSPYYRTQAWGQTHWQEFEQVKHRFTYTPYTGWRTEAFAGETLHVDHLGRRRTVPISGLDSTTATPAVETIFAFGGSAMWGHGAPDNATIPAFLQDELQRRWQRPIEIINFGERGHVVTQSLIRLMLELQTRRVPDHVVFYHGFNEVVAALKGDVGSHLAERELALRVETPFRTWLSHTRVLSMLRRNSPFATEPVSRFDPSERLTTARAIVDNYLGAHRLLRAWSDTHGFSTTSFWQPVRNLPTDGPESTSRSRELAALVDATYAEFARASASVDNLDSLASTLDESDPMIWADQVHLTPLGNQVIARAIAEKMPAPQP